MSDGSRRIKPGRRLSARRARLSTASEHNDLLDVGESEGEDSTDRAGLGDEKAASRMAALLSQRLHAATRLDPIRLTLSLLARFVPPGALLHAHSCIIRVVRRLNNPNVNTGS
jgi:hypothetical protein